MFTRLLKLTCLLLFCLAAVGTGRARADHTLPAIQDATLDYANPALVDNGSALSVGYSNFLGHFRPTTRVLLQFDLSQVETIERAALRLDISTNLLQAQAATVALYAVAADQWQQTSVSEATAPAVAATPLASVQLDQAAGGTLELGTTAGSSLLSQYLEAQRQTDGRASLLLRLDGVSGGDLAGTLAFSSREGGSAPTLVISSVAVPTAVTFAGSAAASPAPILLLAAAGLLLVLTFSTFFTPAARRRRRTAQGGRAATLLPLFFLLHAPLPLAQPPLSAAAACTRPVTPADVVLEMSAAPFMHWSDDPANDGGYVIWRATNSALPDTTQPPHATLNAGQTSFFEPQQMNDVAWTYVVAGRNSCGDLSAPSAPYGARHYPLSGGQWQPITVAFSNPMQPIGDAAALLSHGLGLEAVMRWDGERQLFAIYRFNDDPARNFPLEVGDTVFVLPQEWAGGVAFAGPLQRHDYTLETGGLSFLSVPLYRADVDSAADLFHAIGSVEMLYVWDAASGDFVPYDGRSANLPLAAGQPVAVKLAADAARATRQWPGDSAHSVWAERTQAGQRQIYLRWYDGGSAVAGYNIYSRALSEVEWTYRGATAFAPTQVAFNALVPFALRQALATDLGIETAKLYDHLRANPQIAQLHADRHPALAQAIGQALFVPGAAVDTLYRIERVPADGNKQLLHERCVPAAPAARVEWTYTPLKVQAANPAGAPDGLGRPASPRPLDAAERHNWDTAQAYRQMDGRAFLRWNAPTPPAPTFTPTCAVNADETIAGYNVYRRHDQLTGGSWQLANPVSSGGTSLYVRHVGGDFQFEDALTNLYGPAAYGAWDYRVCAVDHLGKQAQCERLDDVIARELDAPAAVEQLRATFDADHTQLTVSWQHADAAEHHTPVQFVVSRAVTPSAGTWADIATTAAGSIQIARQAADENVTYWYRVQVRDDAGNWSAPSAPVPATFRPRSAAPFDLGLDNTSCASDGVDALPHTLNGLNPRIVQVALYRGYSSTGPWQIVDRFRVEGGSVTIVEDATPPTAVETYYLLEAFDGHGNPSAPQIICVPQPGAHPLPQPPVDIIWPQSKEDDVQIVAQNGGPLPDGLTVRVIAPGPDGPQAHVVQPDGGGNFAFSPAQQDALASGGTLHVEVMQTDVAGTPSRPAVFSYRPGHPIDPDVVNRTALDLGPVFAAEWDTDAHRPTIEIALSNKYACEQCVDYPYIALFRRIVGGRWQQVNRPVRADHTFSNADPTWRLIDDYDLSPQQSYQYRVVLLSPVSLEPLATVATFQVDALAPAQTLQLDTITPVANRPACLTPEAQWPRVTPAAAGLRNSITLPHADIIISSYYPIDADCDPADPTLASAFGEGTLQYGGETFAVQFYGLHIKANGQLQSGRIVADLGGHVSPGNPLIEFLKIEGSAAGLRAEVRSRLPQSVMLVDPLDAGKRFSQVGAVSSLGADWLISDVLVSSYLVLDENLPWLFAADSLTLDGSALHLPDNTPTRYRFASAAYAEDSVPLGEMLGNNLGFAEPTYQTQNVAVAAAGFQGLIATEVEWTYMTGQPAAFEIGFARADLTLADGQITGGMLHDAYGRLRYYSQPTTQYTLQRLEIDRPPVLTRDDVETPVARDDAALRQHFILPADTKLALDENGAVLQPVVQNSSAWRTFSTNTQHGHLFLAPAVSDLDPVSNGWRARFDADGLRYEPGLNLHRVAGQDDAGSVAYSCFSGEPFHAALALVVRRGGVSGQLHFTQAEENVRSLYDFPTQVRAFDTLFLDNRFIDPAMDLNIQLPYPSDFVIPSTIGGFDADACPAAGQPTGDAGHVTHAYWALGQNVNSLAFINTDPILYPAAGRVAAGDLPTKVLQLRGILTLPGATRVDDPAGLLKIEGLSEWFPNGDVGDIRLVLGQGDLLDVPEVRVNGVYHFLTDLLPTRYFGPDGLPDLAGLAAANILAESDLDAEQLLACAQNLSIGCGITILDGYSSVDMFGELEDALLEEANAWLPVGSSPIALYNEYHPDNNELTGQIRAFINEPNLAWEWANGSEYNEWGIPVKLMAGPEGAVVAGVLKDLALVSDAYSVIHGDFGFVVTMRWDAEALIEEVGIYSGYAASQAVLRALGHYFKHDTAFPTWSPELRTAMDGWAEQFGYPIGAAADDDPVDLIEAMWAANWQQKRFHAVYSVLEGRVRQLNGSDAYGISSLQTGPILDDLGVTLKTNLGAALIVPFGEGKVLQNLYFGTELEIEGESAGELFIDAEWVRLEYDKDGEFRIFGNDVVTALSDDLTLSADLALIVAWADGSERIEGGVVLKQFEVGAVTFRHAGGAFGVGRYDGDLLLYIGVKGEGSWDEYVLGGSFLIGNLYDSPVLRHAGFNEALTKFTAGNGNYPVPFFGFYLNVYGEFPLYDSGALRANGRGELTFWYVEGTPGVWGGQVEASVYATLAEIVSGRGTLNLLYETLRDGAQTGDAGWASLRQRCAEAVADAGCSAFSGTFWIAGGVGSCEPNRWREWERRWWRDSWCYQVGAIVGLSYLDDGAAATWRADYDVDWE